LSAIPVNSDSGRRGDFRQRSGLSDGTTRGKRSGSHRGNVLARGSRQ
jgi:hypothetical protein